MPLYESHVTVQMGHQEFLDICRANSLKAVVITDDTASAEPRQMMTAKFHPRCTQEQAIEQLDAVASKFPASAVLRKKLEIIVADSEQRPPCLYQETHSKYHLPEDMVAYFTEVVTTHNGHVSRNALKLPGEGDYRFATTRNPYDGYRISGILAGHPLIKHINTIRELVVFDTNPSIDQGWICECGIKI